MSYDSSMIRRISRTCLLGTATTVCAAFSVGIADTAPSEFAEVCGQELQTRDVLVLDLQHLYTTPDLADDFVLERAGDYVLANPLIDEFRMPFRPAVDPDGVIRAARKYGVKKGCDLVLILKTGPYLGKQRGRSARVKDHGYAFVAAGQRVYPMTPGG
jgi:hypothetical protein